MAEESKYKKSSSKNDSQTAKTFLPPNDLEAEQSLLGSILLNSKLLDDVADKLRTEVFYDPRHTEIFSSMIKLWTDSKPCDVIFVMNQIDLSAKKNNRESSITQDYLLELISKSSLASSSDALVNILKDKFLMRTLVSVGDDLKNMASNEVETPSEVLDQAQKKLYEVSLESMDKNFVSINEILLGSFERLSELQAKGNEYSGVPTGLIDLDKSLGGMHNSDLIILAARPAMGKTSLALEIAKRVALIEQAGVAIFSLEMSKEQLVDKMLSSVSGVDNWKIRTGKFDEARDNNEFQKIGEAIGILDQAPIWIDDSGALNVLELRSKARRLKTRHNIGLIIIDYLQLMSGTGRNYGNNRVQEVSDISRGLKILAKELDIPIIALSQLSRSVEGREDKRPMLSDLRESGSIEQDADVVMFVHREEMYHKETKRKGIADILIAKHRHGSTGSVELAWLGRLATFENLENSRKTYKVNE
jgi:replicative DNA helicase